MTLIQARCVVEVASCGTLREAAKNLYASPSAVSQAISSLEQELNLQIFSRSRTGSALTASGAAVYAICIKITQSMEDISRLASATAGGKNPDIIRVGFCNFGPVVDSLLCSLADSYSLSIHRCSITDMEFLINNGFLELAFCTGIRSTYLRHTQEHNCQLISHDDLQLAMRPDNPLAALPGPTIQPESLSGAKWCFYNPDLDILLGNCIPNYYKNCMQFSSNSVSHITDIVSSTDLITLLPPALIPPQLAVYNIYLREHRPPRLYNYLLFCKGLSDNDSDKNRRAFSLANYISLKLRQPDASD